MTMPEIVIYTAKDGHIDETVWLTQKQLSELFDKNVRTISEHISNIFQEAELEESSVVRDLKIF